MEPFPTANQLENAAKQSGVKSPSIPWVGPLGQAFKTLFKIVLIFSHFYSLKDSLEKKPFTN